MSLRGHVAALRVLTDVKVTQQGFKTSPGPNGQSCTSCEYGEEFSDSDKDTEGVCRLWKRDVGAKAWCESWTKSDRLKHVKPDTSADQKPDRETQLPSQKRAAAMKAAEPPPPKKTPKPAPKPDAEDEPEDEPEEEPEDKPAKKPLPPLKKPGTALKNIMARKKASQNNIDYK